MFLSKPEVQNEVLVNVPAEFGCPFHVFFTGSANRQLGSLHVSIGILPDGRTFTEMSGEAMVRVGKFDAFPVFSGSRLSENSDFSNRFANMLQNT